MLCFLVGGQECTLGDCGGARKLHLVIFVGPGNYVICLLYTSDAADDPRVV